MTRLLSYLILPSEVTPFERRYLQRVNKIALGFFWLHPPVFVLIAILAGTRPSVAFGLALAAMVGPMLAYFGFPARPRLVAMIYGVTAMLMAGILVYIGQGPMQIEMHFYFFVLIALLAVFGNPLVILVAAATVAGHHFVMWLVVPRGVFNYDATIWSVVVHAAFVVIESVAACFVARSFFDNVIGLEKIVTNRTRALDARNQDMARILDNVAQGFVSAGFDGTLGTEWSKSLVTWFGEPRPGVSIAEYLFGDSEWRFWMEFGLESLRDGSMPFEIVVMQWPYRISRGGRELRVDYRALGDRADAMLVVVSDITDEVARQRAEAGQRELVVALDKASRDRAGFASFLAVNRTGFPGGS
jgi:two-component system, chemotaxis family, sensor kinase CheA